MARVFAILGLIAICFSPLLKGQIALRFHPAKLQVWLPYREKWEGPPLSEEIAQILRQPFHFLGHGSQTYVFESADGKNVLKLFRYNRSRFPLIRGVKSLFHKKQKAPLFEKLDKTFQAYAMALREIPEGTGLLYIHLNPSDEKILPTVRCSDSFHRTWNLPLDRFRFALQRKAEPFLDTLSAALEKEEVMKGYIDSFLSLLKTRAAKGIRNSDPNMGPNFGFLEGKAIEIDCGNFRWRPELFDPVKQKEEICRFSSQLEEWLGSHNATYKDYLLQRSEELIQISLQS